MTTAAIIALTLVLLSPFGFGWYDSYMFRKHKTCPHCKQFATRVVMCSDHGGGWFEFTCDACCYTWTWAER